MQPPPMTKSAAGVLLTAPSLVSRSAEASLSSNIHLFKRPLMPFVPLTAKRFAINNPLLLFFITFLWPARVLLESPRAPHGHWFLYYLSSSSSHCSAQLHQDRWTFPFEEATTPHPLLLRRPPVLPRSHRFSLPLFTSNPYLLHLASQRRFGSRPSHASKRSFNHSFRLLPLGLPHCVSVNPFPTTHSSPAHHSCPSSFSS